MDDLDDEKAPDSRGSNRGHRMRERRTTPHQTRDQHLFALMRALRELMEASREPDLALIQTAIREAKAGGLSDLLIAKLLMLVPGIETWLRHSRRERR